MSRRRASFFLIKLILIHYFINPLFTVQLLVRNKKKKKNKTLNKPNNLLVSQRMIDAISCYYCSSKIHGSDCNDPFLADKQQYLTTFNSSYRACAVIIIITIDFMHFFFFLQKIILATIYGGVTIRGPRKKCNSMDDDTGSLWCCYTNACNNGQQIRFQLEAIVYFQIVLFLLYKSR